MKKFFFAAVAALVSLICISVSANAEGTESVPAVNYASSITANLQGIGEGIELETSKLVLVYNLMPQKVKDLCVESYKEIAPRIERSGNRSFRYQGVTITPSRNADGGTDLKFSYQGHSLVVNNYNRMEFDSIFGI